LVLYSWDNLDGKSVQKLYENVEFFSSDGQKIWTVNGMDHCKFWRTRYGEDDFFVSIGNDGKDWILNSFSGNSYKLYVVTVKVTYLSFHK